MKGSNSKEEKYCFVIKMKTDKFLLSNEWFFLYKTVIEWFSRMSWDLV